MVPNSKLRLLPRAPLILAGGLVAVLEAMIAKIARDAEH
jgi:hypothetical protein